MCGRSIGRLRNIEKRLGLTGPCQECGGRGRFGCIVVMPGESDAKEPQGCATCGKVGGGLMILLEPDARAIGGLP